MVKIRKRASCTRREARADLACYLTRVGRVAAMTAVNASLIIGSRVCEPRRDQRRAQTSGAVVVQDGSGGAVQDDKPQCRQSIGVADDRAADCRPRDAVPSQEATEQIAQIATCQGTVVERDAGNVPVVQPGEMAKDIAGVGIAENEPGLALVGQAIVGFHTEASARA